MLLDRRATGGVGNLVNKTNTPLLVLIMYEALSKCLVGMGKMSSPGLSLI